MSTSSKPKPNAKDQSATPPLVEAADLIIQYLEQLGVEHVFGVPGGSIEPLFNALARSERRGTVRPIVARHETGAGFMGDGYFHETDRLAVVCSTSGPGATNLVTSVASAYEERIPLLVITAQTPLYTFGRGAVQESSCTGVNVLSLLQPITRYNSLVSHIAQLEHKLVAAIMTALQSPNGPAHLSIPRDLLQTKIPNAAPAFDLKNLLDKPMLLDDHAVERFIEEITSGKPCVFVVGEGCVDATEEILAVARKLQAPIVTPPHGKGLVSPFHPLYKGVIGFAGHDSANDVLLNPKVERVIAIGTALSEFATNNWDSEAILNNRLIHVDEVEYNFTRSPMARMHVRGSIRTIFSRLLEILDSSVEEPAAAAREQAPAKESPDHALPAFILDEPEKCTDDSEPIKPQRLMTDLTRLFPPQTRWFADTGASIAWGVHYLHPYDRRIESRRRSVPGRRSGRRRRNDFVFRTSVTFSSMGWAIGASVGAALGFPDSPVVCLTGDGSMLMSGQEISTAVRQRLSVVFVVLNDGGYGMVKHGQRLGSAEHVGTELPQSDFAALARSLGAEGFVINSPQDLQALDIDAICSKKGPTLLDVRIDPEECPPMGARVKMLTKESG